MKLKGVWCVFLFCLSRALLASDHPFTITIERNMTCGDKSTIGRLLINNREIGRTLELPWRNNEPAISRVPEGLYPGRIRADGKLSWRIELEQVRDRKWVQIHLGNFARQIEGCVLVGTDVSQSGTVCMVTNSKNTLNRLADEMAKYSSTLGVNQSAMIAVNVQIR